MLTYEEILKLRFQNSKLKCAAFSTLIVNKMLRNKLVAFITISLICIYIYLSTRISEDLSSDSSSMGGSDGNVSSVEEYRVFPKNETGVFIENVDTVSPTSKSTLIEIFDTAETTKNYLSDQNHCQIKNNTLIIPSIAFLKTHKCGSSLFKHVIARFDSKHPFYKARRPLHRFNPYIGGYPGRYKREFDPYNSPAALKNHVVWNLPEIVKAFENVTVEDITSNSTVTESYHTDQIKYTKRLYKIGLIRQPLANWISTYNFWFGTRIDSYYNKSISCFGEPYLKLISTFENYPNKITHRFERKLISTFLDFALKDQHIEEKIKSSYWGFRTMNYMSMNFGLDFDRHLSDQEIQAKIDEFDIVIILERSLESLLLLKHLLCMDFEDLRVDWLCDRCKDFSASDINDIMNVEFDYLPDILKEHNITVDQAKMVEEKFLFNDVRLYNAAGKKFKKNIEMFGIERMKQELKDYQKYQEGQRGTSGSEASSSEQSDEKEEKNDADDLESESDIEQSHKKSIVEANNRFYGKFLKPTVEKDEELEKHKHFNRAIANYMINEGRGYCSYFKMHFDDLNLKVRDDGLGQPWWREPNF